jgi:hypothetical protein
VLGRLASYPHGLRVLIETLLHGFEQVFVLPTCDSALRTRRTTRFEKAARACRRPLATQHLAVLLAGVTIGELLTGWAAADIL